MQITNSGEKLSVNRPREGEREGDISWKLSMIDNVGVRFAALTILVYARTSEILNRSKSNNYLDLFLF